MNNTTKVATVIITLIAVSIGFFPIVFITISLKIYTYFCLIAQHCVQ